MKPFLESAGFTALGLSSLAHLRAQTAGASGAVVSMAVASSTGMAAEDVVAELRKLAPRLPITIAGLLELDRIAASIERMGGRLGAPPIVLGVSATAERHGALGAPNTFLYVCKSDLLAPDRRAQAACMIQRHFH